MHAAIQETESPQGTGILWKTHRNSAAEQITELRSQKPQPRPTSTQASACKTTLPQ